MGLETRYYIEKNGEYYDLVKVKIDWMHYFFGKVVDEEVIFIGEYPEQCWEKYCELS